MFKYEIKQVTPFPTVQFWLIVISVTSRHLIANNYSIIDELTNSKIKQKTLSFKIDHVYTLKFLLHKILYRIFFYISSFNDNVDMKGTPLFETLMKL